MDHGSVNDNGNKIAHWQLGNLSRALYDFPEKAGFWFPLEMLRMSRGKRPRMARIMLRGSTNAGKTVLATMAAAHSSYSDSRAIENFTYASTSTGEPWGELLKCLQPLSMVANFGSVTKPLPTNPNGKFVRTIFFGRGNGNGADWSRAQAVVFYDFPGEFIENDYQQAWAPMTHSTDVLAAVLDISDFFEETDESRKRISRVIQTLQSPGSAERALVITKTDLCQSLCSRLAQSSPSERKTWLDECGKISPCHGNEAAAALATLCRGNGSAQELLMNVAAQAQVFFIGTHNLDSGKPPRAEGLQAFLDSALKMVGAEVQLQTAPDGR